MTKLLFHWSSLLLSLAVFAPSIARGAETIPSEFDSTESDRTAIAALLDTYTRSVSTKDRAGFEGILEDTHIPFSAVGAEGAKGPEAGLHSYDDFAREVFGGPPFKQTFRDVSIHQDGPLANVTLVFLNDGSSVSSWGWKTLQLLKIEGRWKIASEFFTLHPDR